MPMRLSEGIERCTAALLLTALVVWFLSGCAATTRPADGVDLPQYARHTPSEMTAILRAELDGPRTRDVDLTMIGGFVAPQTVPR